MKRQPLATVVDSGGMWEKSGFSSAGGSCVEVTRIRDKIRDTKYWAGGHLIVTPQGWKAFLGVLRVSPAD